MSVIIFNETGQPHNFEELSIAIDNNPHGAGIMWVEKDGIHTVRGLFRHKEEFFRILETLNGTPHAIHLRKAVNSVIREDLCQPLRVTSETIENVRAAFLMVDEGTLEIPHHPDSSSAVAFAQNLRKLTNVFGTNLLFRKKSLLKMEEKQKAPAIFMRGDGLVGIINPTEWINYNGIWCTDPYAFTPPLPLHSF